MIAPIMKDLNNPKLMWLKGILLLLIGLVAATLLLLEHATLRTGLLLALCIWGFCRAYYFAFYVIQHYIDPTYRFAGLISFVRYALNKKT